jgi:16S rRNA (cytosine967-C5)-methyltransferase
MNEDSGEGVSAKQAISDLEVRRLAVGLLADWERRPADLDGMIDRVLAGAGRAMNPVQAGLFTRLVNGAVCRRRRLDHFISRLATRRQKLKPELQALLRLGLLELDDREVDRPDYAVVSESVKLAKGLVPGREGFVNAILRAFLRQGAENLLPAGDDPESLAVRWSLPEWLVKSWLADYGREKTLLLCRQADRFPGTGFRVNRLKYTREEFLARLESEGFEAGQLTPGSYAPQAFSCFQAARLLRSKGFREGCLTVQDEGAQLIAMLLAPQPGELILDACAAPGGKSTHLAELSDDRARIIALDRDRERLKLVAESSRRLGLSAIETAACNLTRPLPEELPQSYDAILIDAPCSGLGVIRRRADLRWRKTLKESRSLTTIQLQILKNCSRYLKPGGRLVYATCTTLRAENQAVVAAFLDACPDFRQAGKEELEQLLPAPVVSREGFLETGLLPESSLDGFFAARLIRQS